MRKVVSIAVFAVCVVFLAFFAMWGYIEVSVAYLPNEWWSLIPFTAGLAFVPAALVYVVIFSVGKAGESLWYIENTWFGMFWAIWVGLGVAVVTGSAALFVVGTVGALFAYALAVSAGFRKSVLNKIRKGGFRYVLWWK